MDNSDNTSSGKRRIRKAGKRSMLRVITPCYKGCIDHPESLLTSERLVRQNLVVGIQGHAIHIHDEIPPKLVVSLTWNPAIRTEPPRRPVCRIDICLENRANRTPYGARPLFEKKKENEKSSYKYDDTDHLLTIKARDVTKE